MPEALQSSDEIIIAEKGGGIEKGEKRGEFTKKLSEKNLKKKEISSKDKDRKSEKEKRKKSLPASAVRHLFRFLP